MSASRSDNTPVADLPNPGDWIVERFQIRRTLGQGGFGTVYEARQGSMGNRQVALKILAPRRLTEHNAVERFRQEALLASRLHHPNTITLFDFGSTPEGLFYIAMEYLEGEPLNAVLRRSGALAPRRVEHILRQVLGSLAEAHSIGLIHRDLKPDNIFLTRIYGEPDFVKVLDFGLAKVGDMLSDASGVIKLDLPQGGRTDLTMEGLVCGTPDYMAPEQAQGVGPLTPACDVYAAGLLIYQMLTATKPYVGKDAMEVLNLQVSAPMPLLPPHLDSHKLAALMRVATRKRASERYPDASMMLRALTGHAPIDPLAHPVELIDPATQDPTPNHGLKLPPLDALASASPTAPELEPLAPETPMPVTLDAPEDSHDQPTTGTFPASALSPDSPTPEPWAPTPTSTHLQPDEVTPRPMRPAPAPPPMVTGQAPFIGREEEIRRLLAVVRGTANEYHNHILLIEGDAGIGKSRLLTEVGRIVRETSDLLVAGTYFRNPGTGAEESLSRLVGQIFGFSRGRAAELASQGTLEHVLSEHIIRRNIALLDRDITFLCGLLAPAAAPPSALSPSRHPALVLERLVRLLIRAATQQPMLLVFEDLQFADPTSLDLIARMATVIDRHARITEPPAQSALCMTLTIRPQSDMPRLDVARLIQTLERMPDEIAPSVHISGLSDKDSLQLAAALLPSDAELRRRVASTAHGNPLHILQILQHLYQTGRLVWTGELWSLKDDSEPLSLPDDLAEMLRLRVAHAVKQSSAPEAMQELLFRLAILGRRVPLDLLRAALQHEERPWPAPLIDRLLAELSDQRLVAIENADASNDGLEMDSGSLSGQRRQGSETLFFENGMLPELLLHQVEHAPAGNRLHLSAARAKQTFYGDRMLNHADELAAHFIRAGRGDLALPHVLEAGKQRHRVGDFLGARAHYLQADALLAGQSNRSDALQVSRRGQIALSIGRVQLRLGHFGPAEHHLRRAVETGKNLGDNALMARGLLYLGELSLLRKRTPEALDLLKKARGFAIDAGNSAVVLEADILLGELEMTERGPMGEGYEGQFESALERVADSAPLLKARGLQHLGAVALARGDNLTAERYLARARMIAAEVGDPSIQARICSDLGHALLLQGRTAEGEGLLREAHQMYRDLGDRLSLSVCLHRLGLAAWHRRDLEEAIVQLDEALHIQDELNVLGHAAETLALAGRVHEARGSLVIAQNVYNQALGLSQGRQPELDGDLHLRLGTTMLKLGHADQARTHLEKAGQCFSAAGDAVRQVQSLNLMGMSASWRSEIIQAEALLTKSEQLAMQNGVIAGQIFALAALALVAWASIPADAETAHARLNQAMRLHSQHQLGPLPLLQSVGKVIEGFGLAGISPDLPALQKQWLSQVVAPQDSVS